MLGLVVVAPENGPGLRPDALLEPMLGVPLLSRAVAGALPSEQAVTGVLVVPPDLVDKVREEVISRFALDEIDRVVGGGPDLVSALRAGLEALPDDVDTVLVQDASRVLSPSGLADRVIAALEGQDAAAPAAPVRGFVVADEDGSLMPLEISPRVRVLQGPQAFRRDGLAKALDSADTAIEPAEVVASAGANVALVAGDADNLLLRDEADVSRALEVFARRAADYAFLYAKDLLPDDPLKKALSPGETAGGDFAAGADPTDSHELGDEPMDIDETMRMSAAPGPEDGA
jgi:2-C-methyl-D-erythritol 4-phosphate cytidylyltransferase